MQNYSISAKKQALLVSVNVLWITATSLPNLDSYLPKLLSVPLSEVLALFLGLVIIACIYALLSVTLGGHKNIGFYTNLVFLFLAGLLTTGLGIHATSVIIRDQLSQEDVVYSLVMDYLHRAWSHNMFQVGYYGLFLLLLLSEVEASKSDLHRKPISKEKIEQNNSFRSSNVHFDSVESVALVSSDPPAILYSVATWVWSGLMGIFYAVFAVLTQTIPVTLLFQMVVLTGWALWASQGKTQGVFSVFWSTANDSMDLYTICRTTTESSIIGSILLTIVYSVLTKCF